MLSPTRCLRLALLICCLTYQPSVSAQSNNNSIANLTIYTAAIAEFLEERTIELQPGYNTVVWRSLMPKANIRTVRVMVEDAEVVRQDVSYEGPQVNNEKSPVLHLVIQNRGATGRKRVQIDYLAPGLSWQSDYALVLDAVAKGEAPTAATLDSWVSLYNNSGVDLAAGTVDLVAGEIALIPDNASPGSYRGDYAAQQTMNVSRGDSVPDESSGTSFSEVSSLSAFNRFSLGQNISLNANTIISRFPIFQRARLTIVQRNVFENTHEAQTLGRGGFILLPRGLEVRLVARNSASSPMAAGLVTIYQRTGTLNQIVGQDRISFTPQNGEFSVTQGRSATVFGTRRILDRRVVKDGNGRDKLVTRIEVVLTNRGTRPAEAFVREGIERYDDNQWKIVESTTSSEPLGTNTVQFKVEVPAGGKTTIMYVVECQ